MIQEVIENKQISTLFQVIYDLNETAIWGYEALSRGPSVSPLHSPVALFEAAEREGCLQKLETLCVLNASKRFVDLELSGRLFVNLSHDVLIDGSYLKQKVREIVGQSHLNANRVVIELTERSAAENVEELIQAIQYFRSEGFEIAIDDLGAGYSTLRLWSEIRPDYVKIDRHFINNIDTDQTKQEFVRSILQIAQSVGTKIIGEGVETQGELETLRRLGIKLVQGYFIARPQANPEAIKFDQLENKKTFDADELHFARSLICSREGVSPKTLVSTVVKNFQDNVSLNSVAVVEEGTAVGMVHRKRFLTEMSRPFAMDLYGRRTIDEVMDRSFLQIDANFRIEQASRLVTDRARLHAEEDFVVTERSKYAGMGQVIDLLRQITEVQVRSARHANPLTMLPGNVPIADCVERLIQQQEAFVVSYFDLDYFKPFNDHYGYAQGDQVLLMLAEIMEKYLHRDSDFIGHIGGDDFVAVTCSENWMDLICSVVNEFERRVVSYYGDAEREQGGIVTLDRYGEERFFSFIAVSVGSLKVKPGDFDTYQALSTELVKVKRRAKSETKASIAYAKAGQIDFYCCRDGCASALSACCSEESECA